VEREKFAAEEKAKQDVAEQAVRVVQLQETIALFRDLSEHMYKMNLEKQANNEVYIIIFFKRRRNLYEWVAKRFVFRCPAISPP
jgi:hypothetical protein